MSKRLAWCECNHLLGAHDGVTGECKHVSPCGCKMFTYAAVFMDAHNRKLAKT